MKVKALVRRADVLGDGYYRGIEESGPPACHLAPCT